MELILEARAVRDANMSIKPSALQQLIDSSFPWFTKAFAQWGRLTLPVLLSGEMRTESRAPQAMISIPGSHACGLVPHAPCPAVLSSVRGSLSICAFRH